MSRSDVTVRSAGPDDVHVVVEIYVESSNLGFQSRMPRKESDQPRIERWRHDLSGATPTRWWVAQRSGVVVGFVGIGPCRAPVEVGLGELDTIVVKPSAWRTGIGKVLMATALEALRRDGYDAAALWTLSHYPSGESFYVSTGWRLNGATRDGGNQVRYDHDLSQ